MKQPSTTMKNSIVNHKSRTLRFLFHLSMLILANPHLSEAKIGEFRTKSGNNKNSMLEVSPEVLRDRLDLAVDPHAQTITSSSYYSNQNEYEIKSSSTTTTTRTTTTTTRTCTASKQQQSTDAADLANCFQQALVAANQDEEDIHVGNLLSASARLEATMRRIGFSQSANDIAANVGKIRSVYDRAPVGQRDSMPGLLQYEIDSGVLKGKKLPATSAAMGFLWLGRSLKYQYDMFSHILDHNAEPFEAARHAYDRDLKPHLSWMLQKICQAALTTLKTRRQKEMLAQIGGFSEECYGNREDQETKRDLRHMMDSLKPMLSRWTLVFSELDLEAI